MACCSAQLQSNHPGHMLVTDEKQSKYQPGQQNDISAERDYSSVVKRVTCTRNADKYTNESASVAKKYPPSAASGRGKPQ